MRQEWRSLSADRTLWAVVALSALSIGYAVYNGVTWVRAQEASVRTIAEERERKFARARAEVVRYEQRLAANSPDSPRPSTPKEARIYTIANSYDAALPPTPLAALSIGQGDLYPPYTNISMWNSRMDLFTEIENENPLNLLNGRFDLAFFIVYLYPLLIIALSYNLISQERENGTLHMLLAQPVGLRTFVAGKILLRLSLLLALTTGLSLLGVFLSGVNLSAGGVGARVLLWIGAVALYGLFWFVLAVAVNAFSRSSATNATALVGLWLLFVLVVPSLINLTVTTMHPVPSRVELINATRRAANDAQAKGGQVLAAYYEDHPHLATGDQEKNLKDREFIYWAVYNEVAKRAEPLLARFDEQLAKQQRLVNIYRFLSPAIITQDALNETAGTGAARYTHYRRSVERFHDEWKGYFVPKMFQDIKLTSTDYDTYPQFRFLEEPTGAIVCRVLTSFLGLSVVAAIIGLYGFRALQRYKVTG
jgi:ABC-2 type transport system permease protein